MRSRKERIQVLSLVILLSILLVYIGYIVYLNTRIKEIQNQNSEIMDQMRILYELEKHVEFNVDSNYGNSEPQETNGSYCMTETRHFKIYARNNEICESMGLSIEDTYNKIFEDLHYAVEPTKKIKIYIFKNEEEYRSKIRQPMWSVGRAIYNKNGFYSFEGVNLTGLIPHEITHLLLYNFMERQYEPDNMRWLSEGLATYEESKVTRSSLIEGLEKRMNMMKKGTFFTFEDLIKADVLKDRNASLINLWYAQSLSTVEYMIDALGRDKFNRFCLNMKKEDNVEKALIDTYKGKFTSLKDFQSQWFKYIKSR
jgi:hypothetical protein